MTIPVSQWAWQTPGPHGFVGADIPAAVFAWQTYAPSIPDYTDLMTPRGAWQTTAPRTVWTIPAAEPKQRVFVVTLKVDGLDDYELPVSTIMIRWRNVRGSYIRVTVPNPTDHTAAVLARSDGRMHISAGYLSAAGRNVEEIVYANISSLYYNQGRNNVLMLGGDRYITHSNPKSVTLAGVSQIKKDGSGRYRVRCPFDLFVRPGDTVTADTATFIVDLITAIVMPRDAYMDIEGT